MLIKFSLHLTLISILTHTTKSTDSEGNNSDIFITYGHVDLKDDSPIFLANQETETSPAPYTAFRNAFEITFLVTDAYVPVTEPVTGFYETVTEEVVFVPDEKPMYRIEDDFLEDDRVKLVDVTNEKKVTIYGHPATETANEDILFISGMNKEIAEQPERTATKTKHEDAFEYKRTKTKGDSKKLDCKHLDCDNTIDSVCGGKIDNKKWKYRLFLNECFYRKVNCAFKYASNRYITVPLENCTNVINHSARRVPQMPIPLPLINMNEESRRVFSYRRSLTLDLLGRQCSHSCPVVCTERYEPQCGLSRTGELKTFLNHCMMDHHSCATMKEWRIRPLKECVGIQKAHLQENNGFVAWMRKVGIIDKRGRLVLS